MISSSPGPISAAFAQLQRQQAERNADQAEQRAQALQAQTRQAQSEADRAEERARSLEVDTDQAQGDAARARRGVAASNSLQQLDTQFTELRGQIQTVASADSAESAAAPTPAPAAPPVVNAQGELTGTVINVTA